LRADTALGPIDPPGVLAAGIGALAVVLAVVMSAQLGPATLVAPLALSVFAALIVAFVYRPHITVAGTIVYFTLLPTLNNFVSPLLGATKDLIAIAAVGAAAVLFVQRRNARVAWPVDRPLLLLVGFFAVLYVVNVGGGLTGESGHGPAWFHGVRLACEPLALLVVGLTLREPERTLRWAVGAVIAASVTMALLGFVQQALGIQRLLELGYAYGQEVRQVGDNLRSFGTLDEPFSYAGFLLVGLAALLLWVRARPATIAAILLLSLALYVSYVRTAALIALALAGIAIARRGHVRLALFTVITSVVLAVTVFVSASQQRETRSVILNSSQYVTLNGRTNIWQSEIGESDTAWLFGRGVGAVGTAAVRATRTLVGRNQLNDADQVSGVVDSGYFTLIADIGVIGLLTMLALLARLGFLALESARRGEGSGWLALGVLTVIVLDAMTRDSFTGFPVPWVAFLVLGLAASSWAARREPAARPALRPVPAR
jgi:hypothetical protein